MLEVLTAFTLIAASFAATNFDNLALLVAWLLDRRSGVRSVLAGHLLGMGALLGVSVAFGTGADWIPLDFVGYLGVIPILMGLKGLHSVARRSREGIEGVDVVRREVGPVSIAATQVANGVDTVLVLGPLLTDSEQGVDSLMIAGFVAMVMIWFGLARLLEARAGRLRVLERYGEWLAPVVLIVVGLYILDNTATDVMLGD